MKNLAAIAIPSETPSYKFWCDEKHTDDYNDDNWKG